MEGNWIYLSKEIVTNCEAGDVMKKRIGAFAVVLLLACFVFTFAQAKDSSVIRVCLSKNSFSAVFRIVNGSYFLQDMATNLPIADLQSGDVVTVNQAGNLLNIKINDQSVSGSFSGSVWAVPEDESQLNVFSYQNTQYRGGISTEIYSGKLLVINRINIEHYLYGCCFPLICLIFCGTRTEV